MTKTCVNCGEEVKETDVFCPFCGANADSVSSSEKQSGSGFSDSEVGYCSNCHAKNKPTAQFCEFCGTELAVDNYKTSDYSQSTPGTDHTTQGTHTYGSYTSEPTDEENRKWYQPPKRTRSAKHPAEWFFWSCWGIFFIIRAIFQLLWFLIRIGSCFAKGR